MANNIPMRGVDASSFFDIGGKASGPWIMEHDFTTDDLALGATGTLIKVAKDTAITSVSLSSDTPMGSAGTILIETTGGGLLATFDATQTGQFDATASGLILPAGTEVQFRVSVAVTDAAPQKAQITFDGHAIN